MAIIQCPECGRDVSSKAISCPHCGNPINVQAIAESTSARKIKIQKTAYFKIEREHRLRCQKRDFKVYIDGKSIGSLEDDSYLETSLSCGEHRIKIIDKEDGSVVSKDRFKQEDNGVWVYFNPIDGSLEYGEEEGIICPKCGGRMSVQVVNEGKKAGCLTVIFYILLTITVFGIFIIIFLHLKKKDETVTYAVCQDCGYKMRI